jgi:hypothetical protein
MGMVPTADCRKKDSHVAEKQDTNKIEVTLGLPRRIADLLVYAQVIHDTMAANPKSLPSPSPALSLLQTDIDTAASKEAIAKTRVA